MKSIVYLLLATAVLFSFSYLSAAESELIEPSTRKAFPYNTSMTTDDGKGYSLQLTGAAVRKKFFVNVYAIGHYMQRPPLKSDPNLIPTIINDDQAKEMVIIWTHDASSKQIRDGYYESFHRSLSDNQFMRLKPDIDHYLSFYTDEVKEGDRQVIRWIPGGTMELELQGKKLGTIDNIEFLKALWTIWFGPKSNLDIQMLISCIK